MPDAFEAVFHEFTTSAFELETVKNDSQYQYVAADGSTISFSSFPRFASDEYYISEGHSISGFYSMHINAFYDLDRHVYTNALIIKKMNFPLFVNWSIAMCLFLIQKRFLLETEGIVHTIIWHTS